MADNFLEKHFEDYEARKAAWLRARKLGKKKFTSAVKTRAGNTPSADRDGKYDDMREDINDVE